MSREIARDRDSLMSVCTLPADARVAEFLRYWAESLGQARHAHRPDHAAHDARGDRNLGMTLDRERALSKPARDKVIAFAEKGRRDVHIPDVRAQSAFARRCLAPAPTL